MVTVKRFFNLTQIIAILSVMFFLSSIPVSAQWTYNGDDIYNNTAGSVGIGTSTPRSINPNTILGLDSLTNTYISINAPYESQSAIAFGDQTNGQDSVIYRPPSTRDLSFWTATFGTLMTLTQTGNVGIGISSPSAQLHTTGSVRFAGLSADTQSDALTIDSSGDLSKRTLNSVAFNGESDPVWTVAKTSTQIISGGWTFNTNPTTFSGTDVFLPGSGIWNSNGNVGIGSTAPVQKLDVGGAIKIGDGGIKPLCDQSQRGTIWMDFGGIGVKDTVEVCAKSNIGIYAWRNIY